MLNILQFLLDNSTEILALLAALEVTANLVPTKKDITILGNIRKVFKNFKKFNRKDGGGDHS